MEKRISIRRKRDIDDIVETRDLSVEFCIAFSE